MMKEDKEKCNTYQHRRREKVSIFLAFLVILVLFAITMTAVIYTILRLFFGV